MKSEFAILEGVLQGCRERRAEDDHCARLVDGLEALVEGKGRPPLDLWEALDTVPDAIFVHDRDYRVVAANRAYAQRAGVDKGALLGRPYYELFPRMDGPLHQCVTAVTADGCEPAEAELTMNDGSLLIHRGYSEHDAAGRFLYGIHLLSDVTAQRRTDDDLRQTNELLTRLFETIHLGIAWLDREFNFVRVNRRYAEGSGAAVDFFAGKNHFALYPDERNRAIFQRVLETGIPYHTYAAPFSFPDAPERGITYWNWSVIPLMATGRVNGVVLLVQDVTEQQRQEQMNRKLAAIMQNTSDLVALVDAKGALAYLNCAGRRLAGMADAEATGGLRFAELFPQWPGRLDGAGGREVYWSGESRLRRRDGTDLAVALTVLRHEEPAAPVYFSFVARDISELKRYQSELERKARYDELTGLPNRSVLGDRLEQALAAGERHGQPFAVLFINIDEFKRVNEGFGHPAGDEALRAIAGRLRSLTREVDTVARYGSDEFVVLLTNLRQADDSAAAAGRILALVAEPLPLGEEPVRVTASIGISVFPRDGRDAETLLGRASAAMQQSAETGRNGFRFFEPEANARAVRRLTLESELRSAVRSQQFVLHYQPRVESASGRMVGMEALVRWQHPQRGLVAPGEFIPLAEQSGLILELGDWVLHEACRQSRAWQLAGVAPVRVSVNLSARQLREHELDRRIRSHCDSLHLEPAELELELTESELMADPEAMQLKLRRIKDEGVALAIDDFGTGYSSLSYLHRYPFDLLKVDRSFVRDVTHNPQSATILRTILAMARNLGMRAVAEGVETAPQVAYLRRHGCEELQGYFFERPLPASQAEERLRGARLYATPPEPEAGTRTLLLVDDEPNVTRALQRVLRHEHYRVLVVNKPEDAFEVLASEPVQVVVCDQRMPRLSGTELLSKVKELHPEVVRMVLSGYTEISSVTEAVNRGQIYKFLSKPWDDDEIRREVRSAFQFFEQQQARGGRP